MPVYEIQAPDGRTIEMEGPQPPDENAIQEAFAQLNVPAAHQETTGVYPVQTMEQMDMSQGAFRKEESLARLKQNQVEQTKQMYPLLSGLFPRRMEQFAQGDQSALGILGASIGDVFSLPGRGASTLIRGEGVAQGDVRDKSPEEMEDEVREYLSILGEKTGTNWLDMITRDPVMGFTALLSGPLAGAVQAGKIGPWAAGTIEGIGAGTVGQMARFGEDKQMDPGQAMLDIGASYLAPGFGPMFKKAGPKVKQLILKTMENVINPAYTRVASQLSGATVEALETAATKSGRQKLIANAGKFNEIGEDLLKMLESSDDFYRYEAQLKTALDNMPDMDVSAVRQSLNGSLKKMKEGLQTGPKLAAAKKIKKQIEQLDDFIGKEKTVFTVGKESQTPRVIAQNIDGTWGVQTYYKDPRKLYPGLGEKFSWPKTHATKEEAFASIGKTAPGKNKVSATKFRKMRKDLDFTVNFDQVGANLTNDALMKARTAAKNQLIDASKGTPYEETMANYAATIQAKENFFKDLNLGRQGKLARTKLEGILSNIFNANKTQQRKTFQHLDDIFGTDFMDRTKIASLAKSIVKDGKIPLFPMQWTGRSGLGPGTAFLAGKLPFVGPGMEAGLLGASSPRAAAAGLEGLQLATPKLGGIGAGMGLAGDIMANPYIQRTIPGLARMPYRGGE